jgi:diguanylate cyclase (GGDEF)-like protein
MMRQRAERARRRSQRRGRAADPPDGGQEPLGPVEQVADDASTPSKLDSAGADRDTAAGLRDESAATRDRAHDEDDATVGHDAALDRIFAARDRAAAALDRSEAALDRDRAAHYVQQAYRDDLTGVLQREAGRDQLGNAVAQAHRSDRPLVVAFLDVDHLKRVNDEHGHPAGDRVLAAVGQALRRGLRSYDLVIRYGGDEFVCALPDTHLEEATSRFSEVRSVLSELPVDDASFSVGLVQLAADEQVDYVIARADREMYAKRAQTVSPPD